MFGIKLSLRYPSRRCKLSLIPMPNFNLQNALDRLGWSKKDLADKLGISRVAVSKWADSPPSYAIAYLELALKIKDLSNSI